MKDNDLLTVAQAAALIGCSVDVAYKHIAAGRLRARDISTGSKPRYSVSRADVEIFNAACVVVPHVEQVSAKDVRKTTLRKPKHLVGVR